MNFFGGGGDLTELREYDMIQVAGGYVAYLHGRSAEAMIAAKLTKESKV